MTDPFMGRCGIDCEACGYREQMGCPGCQAAQGKMFWGECEIARCSIGKRMKHCGECKEMPCAMLNEYAYDSEQGDDGLRIANLREWNARGYVSWRAGERSAPTDDRQTDCACGANGEAGARPTVDGAG